MRTEQPEVAAVVENVKRNRTSERGVAISKIAERDRRKKGGDAPERCVDKKMQSGKCAARYDVGKSETAPARPASRITQQERLEPPAKDNLFEHGIGKPREDETQGLARDPQ